MFVPVVLSLVMALSKGNSIVLNLLSVDPLNNSSSMHQTEVGPVIATNGNVQVTSMLVGRNYGDGAPAMGFTTFNNKGMTPSLLPALTQYQNPAGPYSAVTFPSVAWNAVYAEFVVDVLPITGNPNGNNDQTHAPVVMLSSDGVHWSAPQAIAPDLSRPEKNYLACDNNFWSSHYVGNCYVVWDDNGNNDEFHANVSTNGGSVWGSTQSPPDHHSAYGAFPVIQPNGTVVVTSEDGNGYDGAAANIISFVSSNGGGSWSAASEVAAITAHQVAGGMRTQSLPSSGVGDNGTVYSVWQDCRFRSNCSSNDIVMSTSSNGTSWTSPARIPLDATNSGVDHFLPTLSVQPGFFSTTLVLSYYYYPQANCTVSTCQLDAAYSVSNNSGQSWSTPVQLAGPMSLSWLPLTSAGYMVGDYFGNDIENNGVYAPLAVAYAPNGSTYNEATYLPEQCNRNCNQSRGMASPSMRGAGTMTMGRLQAARPAPPRGRMPRSRV
jgi:hypothetical protein